MVKHNRISLMLSLVGLCTLLFIFFSCENSAVREPAETILKSVYSWNRELFSDSEQEYRFLRQHALDEVYQGFYPSDFENGNVASFLLRAKEKNVHVSYLIGDPEWSDAETVIQWALQPLVMYNRSNEEIRLDTVVLDLEYFNTHETTKESIEEYLKMHEGIYRFAKDNDLTVVLCIPYHLQDRIGRTAFSELLGYADRISLTIFMPGQEKAILDELILRSSLFSKPVEVVIETQEENAFYGVSEHNTYSALSKERLEAMVSELSQSYPDLGFSLHHLTSLHEFYQGE